MKKNKPKSRKNSLVVQQAGDETLIYDLKTNRALCLNETSASVWELCNGQNSIADISDLMSRELKALISEDFVLLALNELKNNNLLEDNDQFSGFPAGSNRREIIKRVGFASMVTLPLISSVIAPTAANAQSGSCIANSCSANAQCLGSCVCRGSGSCGGGAGAPCTNPGSSCLGASGTCTQFPGICSLGAGSCPVGAATCSATGFCNAGFCSIGGGLCAGTGPCTAFGTCTFPPGTCSVPGGTCLPGSATCSGSGTCIGTGTCSV